MLVTDHSRRSNPRVLYGMLAESALEQLNVDSAETTERRAYFENLIRLLDMYRYDSLRRASHRAVLDRRKTDLKSLQREQSANVAVEKALDSAREAAFQGMDRAQVVDQLKAIFVGLMQDQPVDGDALTRAKTFLEVFAASLRD
jgi:hypothetical protein